MRTVRPSVSVRSAFRPSGNCFSGEIEAMRPTARWKMLFSTVTRCASFSSRTGSSSLSTHQTSAGAAVLQRQQRGRAVRA